VEPVKFLVPARPWSFDEAAKGASCPDSYEGGTPWRARQSPLFGISRFMIRKLKSGEFRLYSRKKDASTGKRRNLGTFSTLEKAKKHERDVQYFKKH
jgi:hypothetical protein